ncbi:MAG: class I SAM-dependent methyltransferase [Promethearchaeota archaeon]
MEDKLAWERLYSKGEFLELEIHPELPAHMERFKSRGVRRILDLGCGSGRHMVYLAKAGFEVFGMDIAPSGLCATLQALAKEQLVGHVTLSDMQVLPYESDFFDAVISIRVIHHNRLKLIQQTVAEIWRVLRYNGLVWVTSPAPKKKSHRKSVEVEPGTYVPLEGPEKGLPHHLFTKEGFRALFHNFSVLDIHLCQKRHHSLLAVKSKNNLA